MVLFEFPRMTVRKLREVIRKQAREQDTVIFITGVEGSGKSTILCFLIWLLSELQGKDKINLKEIMAFKLYDFMALWARSPKYNIVALDEGKELMGVNFQNKIVKDFERKMTSLRIESHIYIICITNPFKVMRYLREDKISYIFHCMNRSKVKVFKGSTFVNMLENIKDFKSTKLLDENKKFIYEESFQPMTGPLWAQYMALKDAFKTAEKREMEERYAAEYADEPEGKLYTISEACRIAQISRPSFYTKLKQGFIKTSLDKQGQPKITETELEKLKQLFNKQDLHFTVNSTLTLPKGREKNSKTVEAVPI